MEHKSQGKISIKLNGLQFTESSKANSSDAPAHEVKSHNSPAHEAKSHNSPAQGANATNLQDKELPIPVRKEPKSVPQAGSPLVAEENKDEDAMERLAVMRVNTEPEYSVKPPPRDKLPLPTMFPELTLIENDDFGGRRSPFLPLGNGSLLKGLLTSVGAVAVGLIFGFLVLAVFTQDEFSQSYRSVLDGTLQTLTSTNTPQLIENMPIENSNPDAAASVNQPVFVDSSVTLKLPEQSFVMAQFGAFQSEAAAKTAIDQLQQQSYPHLLFRENGKQYLFVAAASSRDDILGMASSFKQKGMDIFVKEVKLPALDKSFTLKQSSGEENKDPFVTFFHNGLEMAKSLSDWSSRVANNGGVNMTEAEIASLKEKHRRFLDESRAFQTPEEWKFLVDGMVSGLNQAVTAQGKMAEALLEKNTEKAESYAWQIQAGVLGYLETYAKWVQSVQ